MANGRQRQEGRQEPGWDRQQTGKGWYRGRGGVAWERRRRTGGKHKGQGDQAMRVLWLDRGATQGGAVPWV